MDMHEIRTKRLLRPFRESDYDDLFEFLSQLADDEFEGYPGITWENGREHLKYRLGSEEFCAMELTGSRESDRQYLLWKQGFRGKGNRLHRQQTLSAAGLRRRSPFGGDCPGIPGRRAQGIRGM